MYIPKMLKENTSHLEVACCFWLLNKLANFPPVCSISKSLRRGNVWEHFLYCRHGIRQRFEGRGDASKHNEKLVCNANSIRVPGRLSFSAGGALAREKGGSEDTWFSVTKSQGARLLSKMRVNKGRMDHLPLSPVISRYPHVSRWGLGARKNTVSLNSYLH